jgi:hypothetical protein
VVFKKKARNVDQASWALDEVAPWRSGAVNRSTNEPEDPNICPTCGQGVRQLLTVRELSIKTGFSEKRIRKWIATGEFAHYRPEGVRRTAIARELAGP